MQNNYAFEITEKGFDMPAPTIQSLRVRALRVPMRTPHRTASGVVAESPLILTDITMNNGLVGHSLIFTYTTAALKPTADLIGNFFPLLQDKPLSPADLHHQLQQRLRLLGSHGLVGMAIARPSTWHFGMRWRANKICRWRVCLGLSPERSAPMELWDTTANLKAPEPLRPGQSRVTPA
jgi:hypothetical protein